METRRMAALAAYGGESSVSGGVSVTPTLSWLPDCVLLEVLSFLSVGDLIRSCRVCKRWKRLVLDKSLWRHVDLRPYKLNSKILWHLVRHWLGSSLQTLKIRGHLLSMKKQEFLTPAILLVLEKRFPSLEHLHLEEISLRTMSYECLPSTLKVLVLSQCEVPFIWFKEPLDKEIPDTRKTLAKLETLILNEVSSFNNVHLEIISQQSILKTLYLAGTYRVNDIGIQKSVPHLKGLEHLKLNGCNITDITSHLIGCHLKHLRTLALSDFGSLTDGGFACLCNIKTLEKLWLEQCIRLSSNCIISVCANMPALNYLNLNGIFFEDQGIDEIRKNLPHCTVTNSFPNMDSFPKL